MKILFPLKIKFHARKKRKNLLASSQLAIMGLEPSQDLNFKLWIKAKIEFWPPIEKRIWILIISDILDAWSQQNGVQFHKVHKKSSFVSNMKFIVLLKSFSEVFSWFLTWKNDYEDEKCAIFMDSFRKFFNNFLQERIICYTILQERKVKRQY